MYDCKLGLGGAICISMILGVLIIIRYRVLYALVYYLIVIIKYYY